jgi:ABC-2 type transport system permease protein
MSVRTSLVAVRYAAATGFADLATTYTWRTWLLGWCSRVLCQVAFFALLGRMLGGAERTHYLLVGNAVMIAALESCFVVASTSWERRAGTLPLLIASPTTPLLVFAFRSVQWLASGLATATGSLFLLAPLFGVHLPVPSALVVVPLIALVAVSTYGFALVLAGLALRAMNLRNVVGNLAQLSLMALCGVQVPVTFWPGWVQAVTSVLPLRHGLAAIRAVLDASPPEAVLRLAALEAAVGAGWFLVAALVFRRLAEHGRRNGSIEYGD